MTEAQALVMMEMDEQINRFTLLGGEVFCSGKMLRP